MEKEHTVKLTVEQHKKLELGSEEVIYDKVFISAATVQTVVWILWALITSVALPQQLSLLWGCIGIPSALSRHLASRERPTQPSSSTISATSTGPSLTSQPEIEEQEIYGAAQQANVSHNLAEALHPRFAPEYGLALQKEMQGFVENEWNCPMVAVSCLLRSSSLVRVMVPQRFSSLSVVTCSKTGVTSMHLRHTAAC